MRLWQKVLASVLAVLLAVGALAGWGSVGSMICIYCLITMGAALLYQRFLINRDSDYYEE